MPPPEIRGIEFPHAPSRLPAAGTIEISLALADGSSSSFRAATPDQPEAWLARSGEPFAFGDPVLFVSDLKKELLREAAREMARELSGYWLRYYNSPHKRSERPKPALVEQADIDSQEPTSAVIHVKIKDGRIFSILASTPGGFRSAWKDLGLRFYFGPCILFLGELTVPLARRAATDMATLGDGLLCLHDTPHNTLPRVLSDFKARHT